MLSESFTCVGPGKTLAYVRGDLRQVKESLFLIGPWLDDYVAGQILLAAPRTLTARVLVRSEQQVQPLVWERILAGLRAFSGHWSNFEVRTLDRLHAKCLFLDERIAYVGSANWYRYSLEESMEIVVRGPLAAIAELQQECESMWAQSQALKILSSERTFPVVTSSSGIRHEILDPLAAQVLKDNPSAFILGKKKKRRSG